MCCNVTTHYWKLLLYALLLYLTNCLWKQIFANTPLNFTKIWPKKPDVPMLFFTLYAGLVVWFYYSACLSSTTNREMLFVQLTNVAR